MVYPVQHKLLTASGALFTGTLERWSIGLKFYAGGVGTSYVPPTQAQVDACAAPFSTFWDSAATFGKEHSLDTLKLVTIGVDGKYPEDFVPLIHTFSPAEFPPGTSPTGLPGQVSQVASLVTAKPRGLAYQGRIYLPSTGQAVGADGRWTTTFSTGTANAVKTLINALNAITDLGDCAIFSDVGAGDWEYVTGVRVGRVPDTVRRRRRQLVEGYQSVTL